MVPAEKLVPASDGTFKAVPVPGKVAVSYGFGGTPPLDLEKAQIANLEQFELTRICYLQYRKLLESVVSKISPVEPVEGDA